LPALLHAAQASRVWLISGEGARHVEAVRSRLSGFEYTVFGEARRHVPRDLVERAALALRAFRADTVVSIGGGSATGLAKALRLDHPFYFVAVPTTYAGSELTNLYGVTSEAGKQTGRDARVVPDVALYDVELTLDMPLRLSVTSLMNALAHPLSALSTGKLGQEGRERALLAAAKVHEALQAVGREPRGRLGRIAALTGTVLAGRVLAEAEVGVHHEIAHALGGRFDLDHAGLHSVLLPHFVSWLSQAMPEVHALIQSRCGGPELSGRLHDGLTQAGAASSLAQLGLGAPEFEAFLADHPALPRELLAQAFAGQRPLS
jgi:alcohol dehydrogenase class IV